MAFPVCLAAYMHLASMTGLGFPNFAGKTSREESFSLACFQTHGMLHAWTCRASAANQSLKNSQDILHHSSVLGKMRPPTWGEQKMRTKIFKKAYNLILQLKGTNCTYHLALSARLLALAAFSLTPLNPVSCVFHQRTREQIFVVCFPLWLCRLFEFNCQAGRCSLFLFFLWCGNQTAVACNMLGELLWLEQTPSCIGIGQCFTRKT